MSCIIKSDGQKLINLYGLLVQDRFKIFEAVINVGLVYKGGTVSLPDRLAFRFLHSASASCMWALSSSIISHKS